MIGTRKLNTETCFPYERYYNKIQPEVTANLNLPKETRMMARFPD